LFILLVVRTRRPLFKSKPGRLLWVSTLLVGVATLILPYLPGLDRAFGFVPLPPLMMALLLAITLLYVVANEVAKRMFYARVRF
jgi:Mg2+-importing ATPase